jgi:hypothetical protein
MRRLGSLLLDWGVIAMAGTLWVVTSLLVIGRRPRVVVIERAPQGDESIGLEVWRVVE